MFRAFTRRFSSIRVESPYNFEFIADVEYIDPTQAKAKLNMAANYQDFWKN
jgi:acyl-CoA reductase-like NAD-dependent aldehyde dehydrogenase